MDSAGNVYVADFSNHTIRKVTPSGEVTTPAGLAGNPGYQDGTGPNARFRYPDDVGVDGDGNVYVAGTQNYTIRKMTPAGVVTTLAGQAGNPGPTDGTGGAARFIFPMSLVVDSAGSIFVGDALAIRKVTPGGVVTTLAGKFLSDPLGNTLGGTANGTGDSAGFTRTNLAVDSAGNLYVADLANDIIRKGIPVNTVPAPVLEPPSLGAGQFSFGITGLPGLNVDLESSSDLYPWQEVGIYVLEDGKNKFVNPTPPLGAQFYRAHVR